jgi:hypothetical protein
MIPDWGVIVDARHFCEIKFHFIMIVFQLGKVSFMDIKSKVAWESVFKRIECNDQYHAGSL